MSLRQLCKEKGYTLSRLSEETKISIPYLSKLNTGIYKNPSSNVLEKISGTLDVSADDVMKVIRG